MSTGITDSGISNSLTAELLSVSPVIKNLFIQLQHGLVGRFQQLRQNFRETNLTYLPQVKLKLQLFEIKADTPLEAKAAAVLQRQPRAFHQRLQIYCSQLETNLQQIMKMRIGMTGAL